jgi:hypothetical protein
MEVRDCSLLKTDTELLRIYESSLEKCCLFCHSQAKESDYIFIHIKVQKLGNRIVNERLRKCDKCDYVLIKRKSFYDKFVR